MRKRFGSVFAEELEAFLAFKRALGHSYQRAEFTLRSFDRFVQRRTDLSASKDMRVLVLEWLGSARERKPVSVTNELGVLRQFCLFQRRRDPEAFVPGRSWAAQSTESQFSPHILSEEQIRLLLGFALKMPGPTFRPISIRALILVLYCTGLRFGEAVRLQIRDVDLSDGTIYVRDSKGRSRWVPFQTDLAAELQTYRSARNKLATVSPDASFFVTYDGGPLSVGAASRAIRGLLREAGLKPARGRLGPRPYDLRHTFAVHRLTRWYHAGVDIGPRLPWLSAYMGHKDIVGTEVYLTATPELIAIAACRLEGRLRENHVKRSAATAQSPDAP